MTRLIAGVADKNATKLAAVSAGLTELRIRGVQQADIHFKSVKSAGPADNVPPQPIGMKQTRWGALTRASAVLENDQDVTFGVGIENGILLFNDDCPMLGGLDVPIVCVVRRIVDGSSHGNVLPMYRSTFASGIGVPVEGKYVVLSLGARQQKTAGEFIAEDTGFEHDNWHLGYTDRALSRCDQIAPGVMAAFAVHFAGR